MTTDRDVAPGDTRLSPNFWRLWTGESVSAFGTYVTLLALQVLVLVTLHGNAQDVGWVNAARWLPYLLFGLLVGAWVERRRRQPVMIATDLLCGGLLAVIPLAWATGVLSVPVLVAVVFLYGAAALCNDAASMAALPRIVPRNNLQRAHALSDGSSAVAQTAGPALAGVLIRVLGAPVAVLVDAASYVFSAVMMGTLRLDEKRVLPGRFESSVRRDIGDGVRWIYRGHTLAPLAIGTHVWFAANATLGVVVPTFALHTVRLSVLQFSITSAIAGLGAVVGASITTAVGRRLGTGRTIITAHLISVVGVVVMALAFASHNWAAMTTLAVGQGLHGIAMGMSNSHETGYRQAVTPDELQARTNITMRAFNRAVIVVFAPVAGLLATVIGTRASLLVAAGVFALAVVVLAASPVRQANIMEPR
ncbi:MFS transporter [Flexivirga sp. B27]